MLRASTIRNRYPVAHTRREQVVVTFQDMPDADNIMAIKAIDQAHPPTKKNPRHFVLGIRPENLRNAKWYFGCEFKFPGVVPKGDEAARDEYDTWLAAADNVRRFVTFQAHCQGITLQDAWELYRVYNGEAPTQESNMAHAIHVQDYLFDRKDLITGNQSDLGQLLNGDEYRALQKKINGVVGFNEETREYSVTTEPDELSSARQKVAREVILSGVTLFADAVGVKVEHLLRPLSELFPELPNPDDPEDHRDTIAIVLAPPTGFKKALENERFRESLRKMYGQLFAWDNLAPRFWRKSDKAANILLNQFNVDCDTDATAKALELLKQCPKLEYVALVPTEVPKTTENLEWLQKKLDSLRKQDFSSLPPLLKLWVQWCTVKGGKPQVIFDPVVIFLADNAEKTSCSICENQVMDMRPVSFHVPGGVEWNRTVYCMQETTEATKFYAALDFQPGVFPDFCKWIDELLSFRCDVCPSETPPPCEASASE